MVYPQSAASGGGVSSSWGFEVYSGVNSYVIEEASPVSSVTVPLFVLGLTWARFSPFLLSHVPIV